MTIYFIQNPRPRIQPFQPVEGIIFQGRGVDSHDTSTIRRINDLKPLYIITQPQAYAGRMMFKKDIFLCDGPAAPISHDQYRKLWNKRHTVEISSPRPLKKLRIEMPPPRAVSSSPPSSPTRLELELNEKEQVPEDAAHIELLGIIVAHLEAELAVRTLCLSTFKLAHKIKP